MAVDIILGNVLRKEDLKIAKSLRIIAFSSSFKSCEEPVQTYRAKCLLIR